MIKWDLTTIILKMIEYLIVSAVGANILIAGRIGSHNLLNIFLLLSNLLLFNCYVILLG